MTMKRIAATVHTLRRAAGARAVVPLVLMGLLLAPMLSQTTPHASAVTSSHALARSLLLVNACAACSRSLLLVNADGTTYPQITLQSAPFRTAGPVTMAWKVASAHAKGMPSRFAVALLDAQGRTRARLADTTRAGRASATIDLPACLNECSLSISVANMQYAFVGYTLAPAP
jgi:hypothetical protein